MTKMPEIIFLFREIIKNKFEEIMQNKILSLDDFIYGINVSIENYGQLDFYMTMIVFKIL